MQFATSALVYGPPEWLFTGFMTVLILGAAGIVGHVRARRERQGVHRAHRAHRRG